MFTSLSAVMLISVFITLLHSSSAGTASSTELYYTLLRSEGKVHYTSLRSEGKVHYTLLWEKISEGKVCDSQRNCSYLLQQGPCKDSEWWVLQPVDSYLEPVCRVKHCTGSDVYMTFDKKCHNISEVNAVICASNNSFFYNFFGEGECSCSCNTEECSGQYSDIYRLKPCDGSLIEFGYPGSFVDVDVVKPEGCVQDNNGDCVKTLSGL